MMTLTNIASFWLDQILFMLQGVAVIIMIAFTLFRTPYLYKQLLNENRFGLGWLLLVLLFSVMAIFGTHAGMVIDTMGAFKPVSLSYQLKQGEAVINFRDLVTVTAGLAGGPWLGASVGAIAGVERFYLGGFTGLSCAIATLMSGLLAGFFRQWLDRRITPLRAAFIAGIVVILQMLLILILSSPFEDALNLVKLIGIPMLLTDMVGCFVFQQVIEVLDRDRLKSELQQAKIRALQAEIHPHFLGNTLNSIKVLIRVDPDKAREYVTKLAQFLREIWDYARTDEITLKDELVHVDKYLDFQELRFPNKIQYQKLIKDETLLDCMIPPRSLLSLVENALKHGKPQNRTFVITVEVRQHGDYSQLIVKDNGVGIPKERLKELGPKPVDSSNGTGHGLYQIHQTLDLYWADKARFEIDSTVEQGTTVTLTIPLCKD
ncbi:MAG: LytS/YhcK type 5TM receptor domain-containing protein [Pseudomonadota bacterium]